MLKNVYSNKCPNILCNAPNCMHFVMLLSIRLASSSSTNYHIHLPCLKIKKHVLCSTCTNSGICWILLR